MVNRKLALAPLIRTRFILARAVATKIDAARDKAALNGLSLSLFGNEDLVSTSLENAFSFGPMYEVRTPYHGAFKFSKHFYSSIEDLKSGGEEFECAQAIDRLPEVECWVRNVSKSDFSFRLPTATDFFYPDFVAKLTDGRSLVVEYKGEHLLGSEDTNAKQMVGDIWARKSANKGVFVMAVKRDGQGRDVMAQLKAAIGG
jgi:type III restriction enzyme